MDAAYNSLAMTYLKGKLIENNSAKALKDMIRSGVADFSRAMVRFLPDLPAPLEHACSDYGILNNVDQSSQLWARFAKIWLETPDDVIDSARDNLHNLVLVHGDMADCTRFGKFQLTYPSNAVGYSGFTRLPLSVYDVLLLTEQGGHVLSSSKMPSDVTHSLDLNKTAHGTLSDHDYFLYTKRDGLLTGPISRLMTQGRRRIDRSILKYYL